MNDLEEVADGFDQRISRYIVGIDLGTTNCAVAFVDSGKRAPQIENFPIEQWTDFGTSEKRGLLPSFHYQPLPEELDRLGGKLGGSSDARSSDAQSSDAQSSDAQSSDAQSGGIVGVLARERGLQLPGRQISSAKSWLCHPRVDRQSPILPWQSDEGVDRLSPVEASSRYLAAIKRAWDKAHPGEALADQDIVLTLPASFDQVARQLTIQAAQLAGLPRILLIEEPQAALYAWLARHDANWETHVQPGQTILVCDIGGGTTDFTLIRVRATGGDETQALNTLHNQRLSLHRVAVGQHLILGGDNIDLALAKLAEAKLTAGKSLPPRSWDALRQACRSAKESLLGRSPPDTYTIHLPSSGSRLIGGGNQVQIAANEVRASVLDGFFPACGLNDRPELPQVGLQEFGLPYAQDAAITRHLAAFLWDHRADGRTDEELASRSDEELARPDWILFNGGVMTSSQICTRMVDVLSSWFAGQGSVANEWRVGVLDGESLDLAVAFGAAYFGNVRRGVGVEIEAKLACSYYLQTSNDPPQAICVVPGSASPGDKFTMMDHPLELALGVPVQFPIVYSTTRLADRAGELVDLDEENFVSLPPIRTVLELSGRRRKDVLPVSIEMELSQIGTLQMWCQSVTTEHRWKLEFDVRGSTQTDAEIHELTANQSGVLDDQAEATARTVIDRVFGSSPDLAPSKLMKELSKQLELKRADWPPSLLRGIWQMLLERDDGRRKSADHEARWLNLLGYALRPGYGLAADDWRVAETWRNVHGKLAFPNSRNESLILWRRIAGGFTAGQQLTVYQQIAGPLRSVLDPARRAKGGGGTGPHEFAELLRLVGSLELLPTAEKHSLGDSLVKLLPVKKWNACQPAILWAIGRLGARIPSYGPLNSVVGADVTSRWLEALLRRPIDDSSYALALMLCARQTSDRYRDISSELRSDVVDQLQSSKAPEHYVSLVRDGGRLESEEANQILGESLPLGIRLVG